MIPAGTKLLPLWGRLSPLPGGRWLWAIVADDPKVLDSYESFLVALREPR